MTGALSFYSKNFNSQFFNYQILVISNYQILILVYTEPKVYKHRRFSIAVLQQFSTKSFYMGSGLEMSLKSRIFSSFFQVINIDKNCIFDPSWRHHSQRLRNFKNIKVDEVTDCSLSGFKRCLVPYLSGVYIR